MRRSGSEEWQELLRHEEGRLEIEIHDLIPTFLGIFVNRRVNQGARIVDQYVQSFFALTDGFHQHFDASETGKIRRNSDDLAADRSEDHTAELLSIMRTTYTSIRLEK